MILLKKESLKHLLQLFLAFSLPLSAYGQQPSRKTIEDTKFLIANTNRQNLNLDSKLMGRKMPYRVILPVNYNQPGREAIVYPTIYLLHGLTGHFDNWTERTKLREYVKNYNYIIVTPEGDNGWYSDSATVKNDKHESYIVEELIPEIEKKFRAKKERDSRAVAGLSMGGYGSIKFGLKHPEKFALVGSFSGALNAASLTDKLLGSGWKTLTDSIMSVYGAENSPTRSANDVFRIVRDMPAAKNKKLPFIYFDCGTEDGLIASNREFSTLLLEKKVRHEFRQLPGKHDWTFWNAQIEEFLELSGRFVK
ncbi:MAG TPA: alpha/beta hydrolase family protein [Pyrinomonadaceae bacterium]|nr:alpha/beta hydrolase family protein [Pyrinomonadaceae bacterium]